jgi:hypothetical protein
VAVQVAPPQVAAQQNATVRAEMAPSAATEAAMGRSAVTQAVPEDVPALPEAAVPERPAPARRHTAYRSALQNDCYFHIFDISFDHTSFLLL